jgi:hypothetical protein
MKNDESQSDWKLALRFGQLKTPYTHYSVVAEGVAGTLGEGFECRPGSAYMGMKAWASSIDEAIDMVRVKAQEIGFTVNGQPRVYATEPSEPPQDKPHAYDITFTPVDGETD